MQIGLDNIPAYQFCLSCVSNYFTNIESTEFFVNGILYEAYTTYSQILGVKNIILNDVVVLLSFENQYHKM